MSILANYCDAFGLFERKRIIGVLKKNCGSPTNLPNETSMTVLNIDMVVYLLVTFICLWVDVSISILAPGVKVDDGLAVDIRVSSDLEVCLFVISMLLKKPEARRQYLQT